MPTGIYVVPDDVWAPILPAEPAAGVAAAAPRPAPVRPPTSLPPSPLPQIDRAFYLRELEPFAAVYARRPGGQNPFGGGFFHYFALWSAIKFLAPAHVIESGCYHGVGSWILRQALGTAANMTFLSPLRPRTYVDSHAGSRHYFGDNFRDFSDIAWELELPPDVRRNTIIFFDDHQSGLRRSVEAARFGFRHVIFDDNYLPFTGDNAALKGFQHDFMPIYQWKDLPMAGRSGSVAQHQAPKAWLPNLHNLTRAEFAALRRIYDATVRQYYEFPPVWDGPNRVGLSEAEWRRVTKAPLLDAAAAAAFAAKHRLKADAEAKKYTHIVYAEVGIGAR